MEENLQLERMVLISEAIPLTRPTVQGLCEAVKVAFGGDIKPSRIQYSRGEDLIVERLVPESKAPQDSPFVTPYEYIRQHAEIEILEVSEDPFSAVCKAAMILAQKNHDATHLVTHSRLAVDEWFKLGQLEKILRLPIWEDIDCPSGLILFCGSRIGPMVGQIEYAVVCKMR
jgi:hypothetical protein